MNRNQFHAMVQCEACLNALKEALLYEYPDREEVFSDITSHFDQLVGYAIYVMMSSDHEQAVFDGFFEGSDPYMTINGVEGCYVAFNNDSSECFSTLSEAESYAREGWERLQKLRS